MVIRDKNRNRNLLKGPKTFRVICPNCKNIEDVYEAYIAELAKCFYKCPTIAARYKIVMECKKCGFIQKDFTDKRLMNFISEKSRKKFT